jgi:hypothetical protein
MPFITFTPAAKSGRERNLHHDEVEVVMDDQGLVMVDDDNNMSDDDAHNESMHEEGVPKKQRWLRSSRSSFSSSSTSTSSSLFGRLFPFHRAMEDAKKVVFHPTHSPPRVDEFDWKVEFKPATCSGSKRTNEEASSPSEPMIVTTPGRTNRASQSGSRFGVGSPGDNSSSFRPTRSTSFMKRRVVTAEKVPASRYDGDDSSVNPFEHHQSNNPFEYSRPAKRCRVEGGTNYFGSFSSIPGILRPTSQPTTSKNDQYFSSPITSGNSGLLDRTSGSARQQESSKKKNKRLRFIDSRLSLVRRLKVGNLTDFGSSGVGGRNRNSDIVFGAEGNGREEGFECYINDEIHENWSHSSLGTGSFQPFGKPTMAEF